MNSHFDKIYVLNLHKRKDRLKITEKRLQFMDLNYEIFNGTDGSVINHLWKSLDNKNFKNPSYLGCAISHLSIYQDALENGHERILIIEDDFRIHRNLEEIFKNIQTIPKWDELLYLGFIPLSDDLSSWNYNVFDQFISKNVFIAKNLWGLYGYGIHSKLMKELLSVYDKKFPMELDRYFVNFIQPRNKSYGITPQIFAADDGYSDNSKKIEINMMQRSVDTRFAKLKDYI